MDLTRWVITIALGLAPMLGGVALQPTGSSVTSSVSTGANSGANSGGNSGANSGAKSGGNSSNSSGNSGSSVTQGVNAPKAKVTNPHGPLATPCANCHTYTSWKPIRSNPEFNHDLTGYPLRGMHEKVACTQCHTNLVFKNVSSQCSDCHADIHRRQFGANCASCHSVKGWQVSLQAIKNHQNRFPLVGAHQLVQCEECHQNAAAGQFIGLSTACYSCHQQDFLTPVIDHVGLGFPTTCESCHSMDSWFNAKFDHLKYTGYALTGAHATLTCAACHLNNSFKATSAQCYSCHSADYLSTNNPNHAQLGLPRDCSTCHATTDWSMSTTKFDHALYAHYPLTGKHAAVTCAACHTNNNYNSTPTACFACHQTDFNGATNPPHASSGFPTDCSLCHTTAGWTTSTFNHNATTFPLTGFHATMQCAQCHTSASTYNGSLPTTCVGCHQADFNNTNAPPHASVGFPTTCQTCHSTTDWTGATFNHNTTKFPLTGAHITVACATCHVNNNYTTLPTNCVGCHQVDYNNTNAPPHASSGFPTTCETCHSTTDWTGASFNHNTTKFPLTGAHITVPCAQCHVKNNYTTVPLDCYSCHTKDFTGTTNPNHVSVGFPTNCALCHTTATWTTSTFNHNSVFPLTGAHATVACASCHVKGNYTTVPTDCYACHKADYNGTTNPNHASAGFPTSCATCHNTTSWTGAAFDHNKTPFPLTGAHKTVACATCHINNVFTGTPTDCYSCHTKDYNGTTNPNHKATGLPTDCVVCHNTTAWTGAVFDHNKTAFPLTGAHKTVLCVSCHVNNNFTTLPTDCYSCHTKDYNGTTNPNHKTAGFPTTCATCHNTTAWTGAVFDHSKTPFPLTGAHKTVPCASCHINNVFAGTPTDCFSCHTKDYNGTTNPNHKTAGFPTDCMVCHNTTAWTGAVFDHNKTAFPLTGAHKTVACISCHVNNNYTTVPTDCFSCHKADYTGTTNPNHASAGFPTTCATCHNTTAWTGAVFDHSKTPFPLTGAHKTVPCASCHVNNVFAGTPTDCFSCHTKDYNGTTNPNHKTAGFPTDCAVCHSTTNWNGAVFDHSKTAFPLTGAHKTVACASCHVNNNFTTVPTDCYSCHKADFTGTTNPNHVSAGFPTDCQVCHSTTNWNGAVFDHNKTAFPLTGGHKTVACASCHVNNNYTTLPTACFGCHKADFTGTTNPAHVAAGFPTDCTICHSTANWTTSTFNHSTTSFPLTGAHKTVACASCHVNSNYSGSLPTDCYSCHTKDYNGTNNPPHAATGLPTTCAVCHSTTNWTSATFNHNTTSFPLTGAHKTVACATCHVNNNYTTLPTACYGCHKADFTGTTNPAHVAAGFPTDCTICHSTANWTTSTFNHNTTSFPLTGAHTTVACASCHVNSNYSGSLPTDCYSCHTNDYNGTNNPPHAATGLPTTCAVCHSTTNWTSATFNHNATTFPLTGAHVTVPCASCHVNNNYTTLPTDCYSCHTKDFTGTTNPNHVTAGFPTNCALCHATATWTTSTFNHASVFPLTGAHATVACASCHVNNNYTTVPTDCYSCHKADYSGTNAPPHAATGLPTTCAVCHSTTNWTSATFNHNTTAFPLTGAHVTVTCAQCHVNNNYLTLPTNCYGCHQADFTGTTNPAHVASGFPTDCTLCHTTTNWTTSTFNHSSVFPLVGAHTSLACAACHTNNNYTTVPTTCYGCHQADFTGTNNPSHVAANFPTTCNTCHGAAPMTWTTGVTFNHTLYANWALTGAHATVTCVQCHTNNNYNITSTACYSCHQADFTGTTNPAHVAAGFPTDCTLCHSTTNWTSSTFNHNTTTFPLTGAHTTVQCALCHTSATTYNGSLPTTCYGCHQKDFTGTTNPAHVAAGFPTDCTLCHSTTNWTSSTFNHSSVFPLVGAHTSLACAACHTNNNYTTVPTTCYGCHQADFTGTNNPGHVAAAFPTTCNTCHGTAPMTWTTGVTFNHTLYANWALTGAHATVTCVQCHTNNNYNNLPTACYSCHQADFTGTTNPAHVSAGFPTDCTICHSTTNWTTSTFNHATTTFPLTGFHATMQCVQCHTSATTYNGSLPTLCYGCHQADWNGTTNPAHAAAGFPTTCDTCHTTTDWTGATFNHANTPFPLTGAHTTVACNLCHINNVFAGTPTDCYSCHTADYTGTTNPNHTTAKWPTTCTTCHTTTNWTSATLPTSYHTFFPTTHGNANSVCATCHTNSSDYSVFQCTGCHGGNNAANFKHENVNGYVYNSVNCYACHKSGGGG
jgi:Seven Residue Repeat